MPMVAPLFMASPGVTSTLTMVSAINANTPVVIILRRPDGTELTRQNTTVPGHSVQRLKINDVVSSFADADLGSVELDTDPSLSMPIAAQISIDGTLPNAAAMHLDEEFLSPSMATMASAPSFRATAAGDPLVVVQNIASQSQNVTAECIGAKRSVTRQFVLQPDESRLLRPCGPSNDVSQGLATFAKVSDQATRPFGVSISGDKPGSELAVFGFSMRGADFGHLVASMNFSDVRRIKSSDWVFAGIPVGHLDNVPGTFKPQATISNFSSSPADMSILYSRTTQKETQTTQPLNKFTLAPGTSVSADLSGLSDTGDLRSTFVVKSDAPPGAVVANVDSWGGSSDSYVQAISKNRLQSENGGTHPWHIGNGNRSALVLFNPSDTSQVFNVLLHTNSGKLWYKPYTLMSRETDVISINDIVTTQEKMT